MPTEAAIKAAKPRIKVHRMADGATAYFIVRPDRTRRWRLDDYRRPGDDRNTPSLGVYPEISLEESARSARRVASTERVSSVCALGAAARTTADSGQDRGQRIKPRITSLGERPIRCLAGGTALLADSPAGLPIEGGALKGRARRNRVSPALSGIARHCSRQAESARREC